MKKGFKTVDALASVIDKESFGFGTKQIKNIKKILAFTMDELSGKYMSMGSGGGFFHMFFQMNDKTWLGFHCATGDISLSKPFNTGKQVYDAFWENDGMDVIHQQLEISEMDGDFKSVTKICHDIISKKFKSIIY